MNRLKQFEKQLASTRDPEDLMLIILSALRDVEFIPEIGKYYTFIYTPKTPDIEYDQHPLIACVGIEKWGFKGLNFHWREGRNYTWEEVAGQLHLVYKEELNELLQIPYAKFRLNK